jgi:hypothetical protein
LLQTNLFHFSGDRGRDCFAKILFLKFANDGAAGHVLQDRRKSSQFPQFPCGHAVEKLWKMSIVFTNDKKFKPANEIAFQKKQQHHHESYS